MRWARWCGAKVTARSTTPPGSLLSAQSCSTNKSQRLADSVIGEGDPAPDFSLQADDGTTVTRDSLLGKNVVLFFYPKDNTAG
jgi:cytochrome oxidase Cu insertion factor (SCO1/SenC/PrrC family)